MTSPQRPLRPLFAVLALLLIPLAALWVILSSARPARHATQADNNATGESLEPNGTSRTAVPGAVPGSPAGGYPGAIVPALPVSTMPPTPPPRVLGGESRQAGFTLLSVTALSSGGNPTPPASLHTDSRASTVGESPFLQTATAGVGLWIQVGGGLGFKTLTVPLDGLRHVYPFGKVSFAVQTQPHSAGYSTQWIGPGGMSLFGEMPPYQEWPYRNPAAVSPDKAQFILLPSSFNSLFHVTAQALSATGKVLGRPVPLLGRPYNADTLFISIPAAYSAQIKQFRVTVARVGGKAQPASWRIADLPPAWQNGPDKVPFVSTARLGPYAIEAAAAEAEDTSGIPDFLNPRPSRFPGSNGPFLQNLDGHFWTGLPTLRYRINARAVAATSANESWLLQLDRVTPQWSLPPGAVLPSTVPPLEQPLAFLPLSNAYIKPSAAGWTLQDAELGIAFPGQQHWLKFDGAALRSSLHTETVAFHDADIVPDAAFGGDRVVWRQPQTLTTPSGITVLVLNGAPGRRGSGADPPPVTPYDNGQSWWYDRGNAELLLAYRLPPSLLLGSAAKPNSPRVAEFPFGVPPYAAVVDSLRPVPFARKVGAPGAVDARPLSQAGYSFLRLSLWQLGPVKRTLKPIVFPPGPKPEVLPPYSWREGQEIVTAQPLPRHLKTLSLQFTLREQQEQRPFHLTVPVRASPPPEWDPKPPGLPR